MTISGAVAIGSRSSATAALLLSLLLLLLPLLRATIPLSPRRRLAMIGPRHTPHRRWSRKFHAVLVVAPPSVPPFALGRPSSVIVHHDALSVGHHVGIDAAGVPSRVAVIVRVVHVMHEFRSGGSGGGRRMVVLVLVVVVGFSAAAAPLLLLLLLLFLLLFAILLLGRWPERMMIAIASASLLLLLLLLHRRFPLLVEGSSSRDAAAAARTAAVRHGRSQFRIAPFHSASTTIVVIILFCRCWTIRRRRRSFRQHDFLLGLDALQECVHLVFQRGHAAFRTGLH